jgi:antibiotic biosynthesis monooxygenase (ABM) superfamily enzyme
MGQQTAPPRWKSIVLTFVVVYPTLSLLTHWVAPNLAWLPGWLRTAVLVAIMCVALSYLIPALGRALSGWLQPVGKQ